MKEKLKELLAPICVFGIIALLIFGPVVVQFYVESHDNILTTIINIVFIVIGSLIAIAQILLFCFAGIPFIYELLLALAKNITLKRSFIFLGIYFFGIFIFKSCDKISNRHDFSVDYVGIAFPFFAIAVLFLLKMIIFMYDNYQKNKEKMERIEREREKEERYKETRERIERERDKWSKEQHEAVQHLGSGDDGER